MRLLSILTVACLVMAGSAAAQVTVDLHALQALPERPRSVVTAPHHNAASATHGVAKRDQPVATAGHPSPVAGTVPERTPDRTAASQSTPTAQSAQAQAAPAQPPTMPQVPPQPPSQTAALSPSAPAPSAPALSAPAAPAAASASGPAAVPPDAAQTASVEPSAPPPAPVTPEAPPTSASQTLRLIFPAGKTDLSADDVAAIKKLTAGLQIGDATTFTVMAYAAASPDDPSTARRLSLSRALAIRDALIADGVPSPRIHPRAMGAPGAEGPADRADLDVEGALPPPGASTPTQAAPPQAAGK